jgi:hypothetical protein
VWCSASEVYFYAWVTGMNLATPGRCTLSFPLPDGGTASAPVTQSYQIYASYLAVEAGSGAMSGPLDTGLRSSADSSGDGIHSRTQQTELSMNTAQSIAFDAYASLANASHGSGAFFITGQLMTCDEAAPDPSSAPSTFGVINFKW